MEENYKSPKIIGLTIDEFDEESGVDMVALVFEPAIESDFQYFKSQIQEFESYSDYPKGATENAKVALRWAEENGWGSCGTSVGKARANQLAKGEPISEETIARMSAFERHRQNSDKELGDGCGRLMWLCWGGDAGIEWAQRKLKSIRKEEQSSDFSDEQIFEKVLEDIMNTKYISDLPEDRIEDILKELDLVGLTQEELELEGWVIEEEEDIEQAFTISSKPDLPSLQDYGKFEIRYRYTGPEDGKNRDFCARMMEKGLIFRKEDINTLTIKRENSEFGIYDIFTYKGSYGCRHHWTRLRMYKDGDKEITQFEEAQDLATSVNSKPTLNRNPNGSDVAQTDNTITSNFAKTSKEKQLIAGPLMIPKKLIYRYDEEMGEYYVYFSEDTIEKIAYKYLINNNQGNVNYEHSEESILEDITLTESWLVENPKMDKSLALMGEEYPKGTWFGVMKVNNTDVWENYVKSGKVKGFSVEGMFADKLINASKQKFYYRTTEGGEELIIDINTLGVFKLEDGERKAVMSEGEYKLTNGELLVVVNSKAKVGSF